MTAERKEAHGGGALEIMTFREAFSTNIAKELKKKGMSINGFAKEAGMPLTTVHSAVTGRVEPGVYNAARIARALDVPLDYLLRGANE